MVIWIKIMSKEEKTDDKDDARRVGLSRDSKMKSSGLVASGEV